MRELNVNDDAFPPRPVLIADLHAEERADRPGRVREDEPRLLRRARRGDLQAVPEASARVRRHGLRRPDRQIRRSCSRSTTTSARSCTTRFQHLLIDEYQDTNRAQYVLVKLLAGKEGNIMAVGDEDQSIYRFRGADINNILNFEHDFPGAKIVKLEQNYRSTGNILDAATGVVSNNVARKGKTLFTESAARRSGAHRHVPGTSARRRSSSSRRSSRCASRYS